MRGFFYLFYLLFYMIYLFEIEAEIDLKLSIERAGNLVGITIQANNHTNEVWLNENELYELIGVLHLVQNQIKKK